MASGTHNAAPSRTTFHGASNPTENLTPRLTPQGLSGICRHESYYAGEQYAE
ncbi:TPA: hypothetical protein QHZ24_003414 [Escherichia coli]|nr:hypothetical protein [Escherichia coli]